MGWVAALAAMTAASAGATIPLYPTPSAREAAVSTINASAATVALFGRIVQTSSPGALGVYKMGNFGGIFVAMLAVFLVVRQTRGDEEAGRAELLGASGAGRRAPLAAALVLVLVAMAALCVATTAGLVVAGLDGAGAVVFSLGWAGLGLCVAAVAGVVAQAVPTTRSANGSLALLLAAAYLARSIGDAGPSWLHWLWWTTPFGWELGVRAFQGDYWWALLLPALATVSVGGAALVVAGQRDLGASMFVERPGPAEAASSLRSAGSLAWRLQRIGLVGWTAAFFVYGALLGSLVTDAGKFLTSPASRDAIMRLGGQKVLTDAFLAAELSIAAVIAAGFAIAATLRLHVEEVEGRASILLSTATSRRRLASSHLVIAFGGVLILMLAVGAGAGLADGIATHDLGHVWAVVAGALVQVPAIWLVAAVAATLLGLAPRLVDAAWVVLAAAVALGEFGPLLRLNHWLLDLSPFVHAPHLPGGPVLLLPLGVLLVVTAALLSVADLGYRHRDVG